MRPCVSRSSSARRSGTGRLLVEPSAQNAPNDRFAATRDSPLTTSSSARTLRSRRPCSRARRRTCRPGCRHGEPPPHAAASSHTRRRPSSGRRRQLPLDGSWTRARSSIGSRVRSAVVASRASASRSRSRPRSDEQPPRPGNDAIVAARPRCQRTTQRFRRVEVHAHDTTLEGSLRGSRTLPQAQRRLSRNSAPCGPSESQPRTTKAPTCGAFARCAEEDSNLHPVIPDQALNLARLPIPPSARVPAAV